jgi:hypothetical protein
MHSTTRFLRILSIRISDEDWRLFRARHPYGTIQLVARDAALAYIKSPPPDSTPRPDIHDGLPKHPVTLWLTDHEWEQLHTKCVYSLARTFGAYLLAQ